MSKEIELQFNCHDECHSLLSSANAKTPNSTPNSDHLNMLKLAPFHIHPIFEVAKLKVNQHWHNE